MHNWEKWQLTVGSPPLPQDEVHVWAWELRRVDPEWESLLSSDERFRMAKFHFEADRLRFLAARANLRMVLGRYLSMPPSGLRFTYSTYGKPAVVTEPGNLQFNLSHIKTMAVAAFARASPVGIDIEHLRPIDFDIGKAAFSDDENSSLLALLPEQRDAAFLRCWTRKEAICKAEGQGLSLPTKQFGVSLRPNESPRIVSPGGVLTRSWSLLDLPLPEYIVGALAISEPITKVSYFKGSSIQPLLR